MRHGESDDAYASMPSRDEDDVSGEMNTAGPMSTSRHDPGAGIDNDDDDEEELVWEADAQGQTSTEATSAAKTNAAPPSAPAPPASSTQQAPQPGPKASTVQAGTRRVSIGWLPEQDDRMKISLAGLVSSVGLNRDKMLSTNDGGPTKEDNEWLDKYLDLVISHVLTLSKDVKPGILPLAVIDSDPAPLAQVWNETVDEADRERAFGELFAQSILFIGAESKNTARRYDARTHRCLRLVSKYLNLSRACIDEYEEMIAGLVTASAEQEAEAAKQNKELDEEAKKEKSRARTWRNIKVGSAAALGAVAVGVTGGLALPAIGASLATFGGVAATTGAFVASASGTALFTTLFTAQGLRITGYKMSKRIAANLDEFEFRDVPREAGARRAGTGLHVSILVSGWAADEARAIKLRDKRRNEALVQQDESATDTNDLAKDLDAVDISEKAPAAGVAADDITQEAQSALKTDSGKAAKPEQQEQQLQPNEEQQAPGDDAVSVAAAASKAAAEAAKAADEGEATHPDAASAPVQEDGPIAKGELQSAEWISVAGKFRPELGETFHLVWETKILKDVSTSLKRFAIDKAVGKAVSETLAHTTLAALMSAIAWPSFVVGATNYIDNSFSVASNRAKIAGEELARAILSGAHGQRPVTLVGYCLGGLVIFHCLQYLVAKKKSLMPNRPQVDGLVLDVIILGAPITAGADQWRQIRSIVSGNLVNGYSPSDWILAVLYRSTSLSVSRISGLYTVDCPGVTNIDVSSVAKTQVDYYSHLDECMDLIKKFSSPTP
ncbi:Transmembrane and coiled-coil domain-containing protein 4 [Hondaea fermentalgiana]|uniref:Transmembrane and coiled-coil domain-containing protein 4 n=1 Tax=Hondaea fermentalgiana TaxID=2315210 RepID=A0A2R5G7G9_9STRA|nr:Transmembrane and coiled-coil domain-containing protein 4 [Hondaea fermentalgiana]|eukprot:GBG26996.1 Transmembrane and coiled-coil domain-containing protein 4 [Hondaea fermentalgiana]